MVYAGVFLWLLVSAGVVAGGICWCCGWWYMLVLWLVVSAGCTRETLFERFTVRWCTTASSMVVEAMRHDACRAK